MIKEGEVKMKKKLLVALISAALVVTSIMPVSAAAVTEQGETANNAVAENTVQTGENTAMTEENKESVTSPTEENTEDTSETAVITADDVKNAEIKVSAKGVSYKTIRVSWEASLDLDGYSVYRATSKSGKFSYKKTTAENKYSNIGVKYNKRYYYKVKGYKVIDGKKVYTKYSKVVSAKAKLTAPTDVKTASSDIDRVKVSWSKVSGADGYKIYSKTGKSGKYTLRKTTKSTTCKLRAYWDAETDEPITYYYKVKAYKKIKGKTYYSDYSKAVSGAVGINSWTATQLETDLVSWLTEKGYTVNTIKMSEKYSNGDDSWYNCRFPDASGHYYIDYESELEETKSDILDRIKEIEAEYTEAGSELVSYNLKIGIEVKDAINPYGKSLDSAYVYVTDNSDAEYNYPDIDEATKAAYVKKIFELVNKERAKAGLAPLVLNEKLCEMGKIKLQDMDDQKYSSHTSPVYGSPSEMAKTLGITDKGCGENLAWSSTPENAMNAWMNSEGHRANILNPEYTQIGIACHVDSNDNNMTFVQEFIY